MEVRVVVRPTTCTVVFVAFEGFVVRITVVIVVACAIPNDFVESPSLSPFPPFCAFGHSYSGWLEPCSSSSTISSLRPAKTSVVRYPRAKNLYQYILPQCPAAEGKKRKVSERHDERRSIAQWR